MYCANGRNKSVHNFMVNVALFNLFDLFIMITIIPLYRLISYPDILSSEKIENSSWAIRAPKCSLSLGFDFTSLMALRFPRQLFPVGSKLVTFF